MMQVREIMTMDPKCCSPTTSLIEVAKLMVEEDCGEIPVCDEGGKPVGVLTDRDIVCRLIAKGKEPTTLSARDAMSSPVVTVTADTTLEDCARLMEQYQVRRLPVIDENGRCCAMVAQADLAIKGPRDTTMEVVSKVSEPNAFASSVGGTK
jgi:CBS domain-containing protein